ncbi:LLM class flavin-dependent oxidoreductase [Ktedonospora formicarum]|uniref:Luciferase-like protein n=1 Tax=Ktedonospora formicarum TaxID=2778364 RepID=A0A8J3HX87_9CHLR|nr:LLM class flavin-dependent oxidoreductase [Ktedonospora formicarum]GHO45812.1 luciferase-like protein [Ktedonospora formicarum]
MRFAFNTPNMGIYGDVRQMVELAREAEEAGWDAFFIWDHIGSGLDWPANFADPWIMLAAMAMATKRIKLGPIVTPLPRRRPWKVAREAVTLDHLSEGRLILGVGIGSDLAREFSCFGELGDDRLHGEMLDEGLEIITRLWSGEEFSYEGKHYQLKKACFKPTPLQQPRIPIWVAGVWPNKRPFRRAAHFDGLCPIASNRSLTPQDYHDMRAYMQPYLTRGQTFDILASGNTTGTDRQQDRDNVLPFAEAGAT